MDRACAIHIGLVKMKQQNTHTYILAEVIFYLILFSVVFSQSVVTLGNIA